MATKIKRAIFHIGSPKTGTSVIQSHMAQNRVVLRDKGVLYPLTISSDKKIYRTFDSHHLLTYAWADWEPFNNFKTVPFFKFINAVAAKYKLSTLLLSAENVFWLPTNIVVDNIPSEDEYWERKRNYIKRIYSDLERYDPSILVYLRRQDHWLESWYNQQIKNGNYLTRDLSAFAESQRFLLDYETNLGIWADIFGKDNIVVRSYEKEQLSDGLIVDFLQTLDLGSVSDFPLVRPPRHNAHMPPDILELMNVCNSINLAERDAYDLRIMIRKACGQFDRQAVFKDQQLLSPQQRQEILDRYQEMNTRIAQSYQGGEAVCLFKEPFVLERTPEPVAPELDIHSVAQIMTSLMLACRQEACCRRHAPFEIPISWHNQYYRKWADRRVWKKYLWNGTDL